MSQSRFNRQVGKYHGGYRWRMEMPAKGLPDVLTRQRKRALQRTGALIFIHSNYGPEPRRIRRAMALTLAKRKGKNETPVHTDD